MTYTMVPITEILQTVCGSCDIGDIDEFDGETDDDRRTEFWKEVIRVKAADAGFGYLVLSILANGFLPGSFVGMVDYGEGRRITQGHHRLVAAILLGMDEVPVTKYGSDINVDGKRLSAHSWEYEKDNLPLHPIEIEF